MAETHPLDAYRLPKLAEFDQPSRFDELAIILERAETEGAIAPLPGSEEEVREKELHESRIRTIRTRLYLLGYLQRDNGLPEIDDKLKQGVRQFQAEAGLTQDSWVGAETWSALQELVSFEHPSGLDRWFDRVEARSALLRATKLRLFVLGFLQSKQAKGDQKLQQALERFVRVARILKLSDQPLQPSLTLETVEVLFDQDCMAERLGRAGRGFLIHKPPDVSEKKARQLVTKFVICCAKVELWLLGYDVTPDGKAEVDGPDRTPYVPARYPFFHALRTFWSDRGQSDTNAFKLAKSIGGSFFRTLSIIQQQGASITDPKQSEELYKALVDEDEDVVEKVWGQIKAIGSRIWDGIRRVWGWFKSLFRKIGKKISTWVKNLARLAYQYALGAFPIIRKIMKVVSATVSVLVHKTLPESDIRHIVISRDADFDYRLFLNPNRDQQKVMAILQKFFEQATFFAIGMRVLGLLIGTLITVVKSVAKAGGWFGLILALVKIYSKLKELDLVSEEEEALLGAA